MSKRGGLLVSLASFTTAIVTAMLLLPSGAVGLEHGPEVSRSHDTYFFGRDAVISSPVNGSVQVYGGNAVIEAPVAGDLLVFGGRVTFRGAGRVGGNLIYSGGNTDEGSRVGGRIYPLATIEGAATTMTRSVVTASFLVLWFGVVVIITLLAGREVRHSSVEVRASAFHCFALGLVAFTSFVITAIVFSYLVPFLIGVPLLAALAVLAVAAKVYGLVAVFHATGMIVAGPRTRAQIESRRWFRGDLAMVVTGLIVLGALRFIPVVGPIVWSCASIFGIGCALATRFGRREPAFLAWRPLEA